MKSSRGFIRSREDLVGWGGITIEEGESVKRTQVPMKTSEEDIRGPERVLLGDNI